jgi:membrane-associated protein
MEALSELWSQVQEIVLNLFSSDKLIETLKRPGFMVAAFVALNLIVFTETGLLIGFFLPGDSLLVIAGLVAYSCEWPLWLLMITLMVSAIVGDSVGYYIGYQTGPRIFNREKSLLFHKDHLVKAQAFYEKHGGKTIVLARFVPIIRTFAPVVAGVGKMEYRQFVFFNVFGGIAWVASMLLLGYVLVPFFKETFGVDITRHIEKVVLVVVFLSILPGIIAYFRNRGKKAPEVIKTAPEVEPAPSPSSD